MRVLHLLEWRDHLNGGHLTLTHDDMQMPKNLTSYIQLQFMLQDSRRSFYFPTPLGAPSG